MKKFTVLLFIALGFTVAAQDQLLLDRINDNIIRPVQLAGIEKNSEGNYDAIIICQYAGFTYNTTGILVHGATTNYVNEIRKLTFNTSGQFLSSNSEYYSQNGGNVKIGDVISSTEVKTISFNEAKASHPGIFTEDTHTYISPAISSVNVSTWERDLFTLAYDKKGQEVVRIQHPDIEKDKKIIQSSQTFQTDNQGEYITSYYGRKDIVNDDNKYNEMKDFDFITFDIKGNEVNRFNVKFPFPRQINKIFHVYSLDDPSKTIGHAFIFQRAMLFGKKYNDPEKNNFDVVYCTNDGKLILHKTSKMGTIEKPYVTFDVAFGDEKSIRIFLNASIEGTSKAGVVQINADGSETVTLQTNEEIKAITTLLKEPKAVPAMEGRGVLGFGNETPGYKWSLGSAYIVHGMSKASNGDMFIYGQMEFEVSDPNPAPPAPGTSTMTTAPKLKKYSEFICIHLSPENVIKRFYVAEMPVTGSMGTFTNIPNESGKIILAVPVPFMKMSEAMIQATTFYTPDGRGLKTNNEKFLNLPRLMVIDPSAATATSVGYTDEFSLFDLEDSYLVDPANNKIAIAGFSQSPKTDKQFELRAVSF